ncbi:MAG: response regulator [Rhodospirillales bacterium]|nr:response regulator [Rhodospirillales bacterium]
MARLAFDLSVLRVLLVEDDTFARELEKTALQHLGITRITIAQDGKDALDALERGIPCDMIVSDWNMINLDGLELLKEVRQRWPGIPFLMITNNEAIDQIKTLKEAGADGTLIKPFSLDKLREAMQLALINKITGAGKSVRQAPANPELDKVSQSIRSVILRPKAKQKTNGTPANLKDINKLAETLSGQLTGFIASLEATDTQQLAVIQLHVECLRAVLSGREDLLSHETQNLILDGLSFAVDLVSE